MRTSRGQTSEAHRAGCSCDRCACAGACRRDRHRSLARRSPARRAEHRVAHRAQLIGEREHARVARASGVPDDHIITVKGGEDLELERSRSARFRACTRRSITSTVRARDRRRDATDDVLAVRRRRHVRLSVRVGGHEIVVLDRNFIERELVGIHPDIAMIAPALRGEIYDYTCRLLHVLGDPARVYATHFDDWRWSAHRRSPGVPTCRRSPPSRALLAAHDADHVRSTSRRCRALSDLIARDAPVRRAAARCARSR